MMRVAHDHLHGLPPPEFLNGVDIRAGLHKASGEPVTQIVKAEAFQSLPFIPLVLVFALIP